MVLGVPILKHFRVICPNMVFRIIRQCTNSVNHILSWPGQSCAGLYTILAQSCACKEYLSS